MVAGREFGTLQGKVELASRVKEEEKELRT
jgi:hypothetical protein